MPVKRKLEPKCLSGKGYGYSARGYLIPCCWLDPYQTVDKQEPEDYVGVEKIFFQDHLKLSNVDMIDDILTSKEWTELYEGLIKEPDKALRVCKKFCGTKKSTKLKEEFGELYNPHSTSMNEISEVRHNNATDLSYRTRYGVE